MPSPHSLEAIPPWKWDSVPDYGPLQERHFVLIVLTVGFAATLFYELTEYFDQVNRGIAYCAIWLPIWFRLLTHYSSVNASERPEPLRSELKKLELELQQELS